MALLAIVPLAHGEMRKVWEVQFRNNLKEPLGWPRLKYHLLSLAFSPDGKRLAVSMGGHATMTMVGTHVFVVDVAGPGGSMRQYDLDACGAPIQWAPDGHALLVCTHVLDLQDGRTCTTLDPLLVNMPPDIPDLRGLDSSTRWLDSMRILRRSPSRVSIIDENCAVVSTGREAMVLAGDEPRKVSPRVWPPGETQEYIRIDESSTPTHRALAERLGDSFLAHFDFEPFPTVRRRVAWDVDEQRVIASWKPLEGDSFGAGGIHPYRNCRISPDGHFVAEGSNGVVRLYRLD